MIRFEAMTTHENRCLCNHFKPSWARGNVLCFVLSRIPNWIFQLVDLWINSQPPQSEYNHVFGQNAWYESALFVVREKTTDHIKYCWSTLNYISLLVSSQHAFVYAVEKMFICPFSVGLKTQRRTWMTLTLLKKCPKPKKNIKNGI